MLGEKFRLLNGSQLWFKPMRYEDFTNSPAGRLTPTLFNQFAFVPNPLPPRFNREEVLFTLVEAMAAIGELKGACRKLQNPFILISPLQRREVLTSSAMEGTFSTDDEFILAEAGLDRSQTDDTREVLNYKRALSDALRRAQDEPITNRMLRDAHRTLLSDVGKNRGRNKLPGEFKRDQNMIGGTTLDTARFIPPPPGETPEAMAALEKYINREGAHPSEALIDIALVHYQIETIHPFADGNGRIGRMLIALMTVKSGLLNMPALYLSPVIERDKDAYIDAMYEVSAHGKWSDWLNYFFGVVTRSCHETIEMIDRLLALQADYRAKVGSAIRSANALSIVDMLFESPVILPKQIVDRLEISDVAARNLLSKLMDLGIVAEVPGLYPKAFVALGILRATNPEGAGRSA